MPHERPDGMKHPSSRLVSPTLASGGRASTPCIALAAALALTLFGIVDVHAQDPEWTPLRPGNTGTPGEEIRLVDYDPDGRLWVGARWPFWEESGVGIYDRDPDAWTALANFETPIPGVAILAPPIEADCSTDDLEVLHCSSLSASGTVSAHLPPGSETSGVGS